MACPTCNGKFTPHCHPEHPTCGWVRCRVCRTTLDLVAMCGYDVTGRRFRIT